MTLAQLHLSPTAVPGGMMTNAPAEDQLWSYLVQMTTALRAVHSSGLAIRPGGLTPTKVRPRFWNTYAGVLIDACLPSSVQRCMPEYSDRLGSPSPWCAASQTDGHSIPPS